MTTDLSLWRSYTDRTLQDHETRVRRLEKDWWRLAGILTAAAVIGSLVGGGVVSYLVFHFTHGASHP